MPVGNSTIQWTLRMVKEVIGISRLCRKADGDLELFTDGDAVYPMLMSSVHSETSMIV